VTSSDGSGPTRPIRLLVSIPVRDERSRLVGTIERIESALGTTAYEWKIGIAEDGSIDGTKQLIEELARQDSRLVVQTADKPMGRGWALKKMWSSEPADIYAFTDADLAAGPEAILAVVGAVEAGAGIAVGSRFITGAALRRPPLRDFVSHSYNWIVRRMFHDGIADHQCGVKAFSREALDRLLPATTEDSWFWDTEILVKAVWSGLNVQEIPVNWTETKYYRTPLARLFSDVMLHGTGLIRLNEDLRERMRHFHDIPPSSDVITAHLMAAEAIESQPMPEP